MSHFPRSVWHPVTLVSATAAATAPPNRPQPSKDRVLVMARTRVPSTSPRPDSLPLVAPRHRPYAHATAIVSLPPQSSLLARLPMSVLDFTSAIDLLLPTHLSYVPLSVSVSCSRAQLAALPHHSAVATTIQSMQQLVTEALRSVLVKVASVDAVGEDGHIRWIQLPNDQSAISFSYQIYPLTEMHIARDSPCTHFTDPSRQAIVTHLSLFLPTPSLSQTQMVATLSILLLSHFARVFPRLLSPEFVKCIRNSVTYTCTIVQSLCAILKGRARDTPHGQDQDDLVPHERGNDADALAQLVYGTLRGQVLRKVWTVCTRRARSILAASETLVAEAPGDSAALVELNNAHDTSDQTPIPASQQPDPHLQLLSVPTFSPVSPVPFVLETRQPPLTDNPLFLVTPPSLVSLANFDVPRPGQPNESPQDDFVPIMSSDVSSQENNLMDDPFATAMDGNVCLPFQAHLDDPLWQVSADFATTMFVPDPFEAADFIRVRRGDTANRSQTDIVPDPFQAVRVEGSTNNPDPFAMTADDADSAKHAKVIPDPFDEFTMWDSGPCDSSQAPVRSSSNKGSLKSKRRQTDQANIITQSWSGARDRADVTDPFATANGTHASYLAADLAPDPFASIAIDADDAQGDPRVGSSPPWKGKSIASPPSPVPSSYARSASASIAGSRVPGRKAGGNAANMDPERVEAILVRAEVAERKARAVLREMQT